MKKIKVSVSILSANFSELGNELLKLESAGAEMIHFDIMDGHFVPNITFGAEVIKSLRPHSNLIFDTHLMISNPLKFVDKFCDSGSDYITIHFEVSTDIDECIALIKAKGKKVGIAIKPATNVDELMSYINDIDLILIMTVEPGFGGQVFMNDQLNKIKQARQLIDKYNPKVLLSVDGGINAHTASFCIEAGADILVSGSYIFSGNDYKNAVAKLKG